MLNEIENGIVTLLTAKLASARKIAVQKGVFEGLAQPGVYACAEAASFEKESQRSYRQHLTVYVDMIFTSLKDQKARREGINLILEAALQYLFLQDLGLGIHPLIPKRWRNVTTEELDEKGLIAYSLELTTSYSITRLDDAAVADLLSLGITYFLQDPLPSSTANATDTVSLPTLPKLN